MAPTTSTGAAREAYLITNPHREAVGALEMTAQMLEAAESKTDMWKWGTVALHNAVQNFMVLALKGAWPVTVLPRDERKKKLEAQQEHYRATAAGDDEAAQQAIETMLAHDANLAAFVHLYERIKTREHGMVQFTNSQAYQPCSTDDRCMRHLNDVRNEFIHFVPMSRGFLLTEFPAMTATGLRVISFLLNESNNIMWYRGVGDDDLEPRAHAALARANEALGRLQTSYAGLPLPAVSLCGSPVEDE